ncbi:hypothetical protein ACLB2K_058367 [Fragaria x ananassa]
MMTRLVKRLGLEAIYVALNYHSKAEWEIEYELQGHGVNRLTMWFQHSHERGSDPSEQSNLDWDKRFRIIEEMNPKVSDFGMARIFGVNQTEANTNRVVGTYSYMSPKYARYGHFSDKSDVFNFGVLLLEIVSGRKNGSIHYSEDSPTLAQWAWKLWKEGRGIDVVDASVRETSQSQEALRCIQSNEANTLPPSKEPAFSTHSKDIFGSPSSQISTNLSSNALTVSIPEGQNGQRNDDNALMKAQVWPVGHQKVKFQIEQQCHENGTVQVK